jgi:hypothetical protein
MSNFDDATLVARFEDATLPADAFGHREHVRVAWILLREGPFETAGLRFCRALRRYAASLGKAERYHETITWAYLALVNERLHAPTSPPASPTDFDAFADANPDLFDRAGGALARLYDRETLESPLARRVFLLPPGRGRRPRDQP